MVTINDIHAVFPKHDIERLFDRPREQTRRVNAAIERQTQIVREYLGGHIPDPMPATVKWVISARVTFELVTEGDKGDLQEKYQFLFKEAKEMLKEYKDGTILPNSIGGKTVLSSGGNQRKRFNFFTGEK
jgi:hypothetical protein